MQIISSLNEASINTQEAIDSFIANNIDQCIIHDTYTDLQLGELKSVLMSNNIGINTFISDNIDDRAITKAAFLKAKYICFRKYQLDIDTVTQLYNKCISLSLEPMFFFDYTIDIIKYVEILNSNKIWIMYDPSIILKNSKVDHLVRYMILINKWIKVLVVHDYTTGFGSKLAGQGDCNYNRVLQNLNKSCYLAIEHGLGNRYLAYDSKPKVFSVAVECLNKCLKGQR